MQQQQKKKKRMQNMKRKAIFIERLLYTQSVPETVKTLDRK
jgi:hypothetical protein